jgi:chromosome segregation ATPase
MEPIQFDKLEDKINTVLSVINELKTKNGSLSEELNNSKQTIQQLEEANKKQEEEIELLKLETTEKTGNMSEVKDKIEQIISKLDKENLEEMLS